MTRKIFFGGVGIIRQRGKTQGKGRGGERKYRG